MRKLLMTLVVASLLTTSVYANYITLNINDIIVPTSVPPIQEAGTTLVPLRVIGENLGATLDWDSFTKMVTITRGATEIKLVINSKTVSVNNVKQQLLTAPKLIKGTTMVPIRFISENLDSEVEWDSRSRTVFVRNLINRYFSVIDYSEYEEEEYYEGDVIFRDGMEIRDGEGSLLLKGGEIYSGLFSNGEILLGVLIYPYGESYEGEFQYGVPHGYGVYYFDNGAYYEGEFQNGMFHGYGMVVFEDGEYYEGYFEYDEYISE